MAQLGFLHVLRFGNGVSKDCLGTGSAGAEEPAYCTRLVDRNGG